MLDLEGDFILAPGSRPAPTTPAPAPRQAAAPLSTSSSLWGLDSNQAQPQSPVTPAKSREDPWLEKELHNILEEIKVISNKIRAEVVSI